MGLVFFPGGGEGNALVAPAGTSIPMAQASAPNGWTSSAVSDTSLRYNSGTGGGTGGTINWSSWNFGGTFNANGFTISVAQMPAHNHVINIVDPGHPHTANDPTHAHGVSDPTHQHGIIISTTGVFGAAARPVAGDGTAGTTAQTNTAATGIGINAAATGITIAAQGTGITANSNNNGSGSTITPSFTTPQVKFVDHILAVKS